MQQKRRAHRPLFMNEKRTIYIIPVNYQGESRAVRGLFKMRFFVEGIALAILTFLLVSRHLDGIGDLPLRITVTMLICMGPFLFGVIGIGGEPITIAVASFFKWLGKRKIMLYNSNARATKRAQGDILVEREENRKTIEDVTDSVKRRFLKKPTLVYKEGENFEFANNEYLSDVFQPEKIGEEPEAFFDDEPVKGDAPKNIENIEWDDSSFAFGIEDSVSHTGETTITIVEANFSSDSSDEPDDFNWEFPAATDDAESAAAESCPVPDTRKPAQNAPVSRSEREEPAAPEQAAGESKIAHSPSEAPQGQAAAPVKVKKKRRKKKKPNSNREEVKDNG